MKLKDRIAKWIAPWVADILVERELVSKDEAGEIVVNDQFFVAFLKSFLDGVSSEAATAVAVIMENHIEDYHTDEEPEEEIADGREIDFFVDKDYQDVPWKDYPTDVGKFIGGYVEVKEDCYLWYSTGLNENDAQILDVYENDNWGANADAKRIKPKAGKVLAILPRGDDFQHDLPRPEVYDGGLRAFPVNPAQAVDGHDLRDFGTMFYIRYDDISAKWMPE